MSKGTYMTTDELRAHPELIEKEERIARTGSTRFERSTKPELALTYFPKNGKILECGALYGTFTKWLIDQGYSDVHALEFVDSLRFADKKKAHFQVIDFNMEHFPYSDDVFDGVTAWGIGEHLENPFHFVREVHRTLKPGGIFIFSIPNVFHIVSRLLFLKKGMFPAWNETNNHISVLPHGIFEKTVLRYFDLVETQYNRPRLQLWGLDRISRFLPANEWFGDYVIYILKARK